jgi:hypothetical protein
MAKNIARNGAPKRIYEVPAHPGMKFVEAIDGVSLVRTGSSRTTVESGGTPITTPTVDKNIYKVGQPPTYPGHIRPAFGSAKVGDANLILQDAGNFGRRK